MIWCGPERDVSCSNGDKAFIANQQTNKQANKKNHNKKQQINKKPITQILNVIQIEPM